ncbi:SnoaL-like polyketide cyclase [Mycobacteroides abscessus subsp. abscessus]|nr:SnoaL-like polyketide cyclase [Mycobacteroides abscessus subsp. abscessus]
MVRGVERPRHEAVLAADALTRHPDLRFEPVGTYVGARALVLNYRNHKGGLVNEVLIFDGDHIVEGHGTYL